MAPRGIPHCTIPLQDLTWLLSVDFCHTDRCRSISHIQRGSLLGTCILTMTQSCTLWARTRSTSLCCIRNSCVGAQVVIVSPLVRTLETASGVFGAPLKQGARSPWLMTQQSDARPAIPAPAGLPFVACDLCRERMSECPLVILSSIVHALSRKVCLTCVHRPSLPAPPPCPHHSLSLPPLPPSSLSLSLSLSLPLSLPPSPCACMRAWLCSYLLPIFSSDSLCGWKCRSQ